MGRGGGVARKLNSAMANLGGQSDAAHFRGKVKWVNKTPRSHHPTLENNTWSPCVYRMLSPLEIMS